MKSNQTSEKYSHILKSIGLFGGVQGLGMLIGVLRTKIVAVLLGPEGMGLMSLFNSGIKLVSDTTALGVPMSGVKELSAALERDDSTLADAVVVRIRGWAFLTGCLGMMVFILAAPLLDRASLSWGDHRLHYVFLSPALLLLSVSGGEICVLKAMRKLKSLAVVSGYNLIFSLLIAIPLFYFWGQSGIVPSIVLGFLIQTFITLSYSHRCATYRLKLGRPALSGGGAMLRLGVSFVMAGFLGSGADFVVRSFLSHSSSLDDVGLYNAGYMLCMTCSGVVFSALDSDYFPRLSSSDTVGSKIQEMINDQIEVMLLLISPLLILLVVGVPLIIPMLYSSAFLPVAGMVRILAFGMLLRAVYLPLAYLLLAKGDSWGYLLIEGVYDCLLVAMVWGFYPLFGLRGVGYALLTAAVCEYVMLYVYAHYRYGYALNPAIIRVFTIHLILLIITYVLLECHDPGPLWYLAAFMIFVLSLSHSLRVLVKNTSFFKRFSKSKRRSKP